MYPKFKLGDFVKKIKGSQWKGKVVGTYSTSLTPEGYAVESMYEKGSVQIYPAAALQICTDVIFYSIDEKKHHHFSSQDEIKHYYDLDSYLETDVEFFRFGYNYTEGEIFGVNVNGVFVGTMMKLAPQ